MSATAFHIMAPTTATTGTSTTLMMDGGGGSCSSNDADREQISRTMTSLSRRELFSKIGSASVTAAAAATMGWESAVPPASAVGPTKINLLNPTYSAVTCPKDKPIPGGMF